MDANDFTERLVAMSRADVEIVAKGLHHRLGSAEGEVAWWKATITIDRILKRDGRCRLASRVASGAAHAVLAAAERSGMLPEEKDEVTLVARAAADVARGLVAGGPEDGPVASLLEVWRPVVVSVLAS
jgi:hypothetical protein